MINGHSPFYYEWLYGQLWMTLWTTMNDFIDRDYPSTLRKPSAAVVAPSLGSIYDTLLIPRGPIHADSWVCLLGNRREQGGKRTRTMRTWRNLQGTNSRTLAWYSKEHASPYQKQKPGITIPFSLQGRTSKSDWVVKLSSWWTLVYVRAAFHQRPKAVEKI